MPEQLIYSVQKQLIELTNIKFSIRYIETYICPIFEYIISSKKNKILIAGSQGIGKSTLLHILEKNLKNIYNKQILSLSLDDYYLTKKRIPPAKAAWVAIVDIVTEVLAGGVLSILAGVFALLSGAYVVATIVLATSITVTAIWTVLFFVSSKHTFQVPKGIAGLMKTFGKERGEKYLKQSNAWLEEVCTLSRENLGSAKTKKVFVVGFIIALIAWILYGVSFLVIANSLGVTIEFFESIMAVMGANAIGNLPITVGGSGLAEFGIVAYINNLDPFNLVIPESGLEWNAVIGWRIATYYVPIVVTWILLVKLALGKYTRPETAQNECPVCGKLLSDSKFASHLEKDHKTE